MNANQDIIWITDPARLPKVTADVDSEIEFSFLTLIAGDAAQLAFERKYTGLGFSGKLQTPSTMLYFGGARDRIRWLEHKRRGLRSRLTKVKSFFSARMTGPITVGDF